MTIMQVDPGYESVHGALLAVSPKLDARLVPENTRARLLKFASRHSVLGQTQYLECRLGRAAEAAQIDLLISAATRFERGSLERALQAGSNETPELWPLRRFVREWSTPSSRLHGSVPVTWLEFDHMERDELPIANVGVCLAPAYLDPFADLPPHEPETALATVFESLRTILPGQPTPDVRDGFERAFRSLPPDARWIHLSVMAARAPVELKLYGTFRRDTLLPYLAAVGWAGDPDAVRAIVDRHCPPDRTADLLYVDLPVTGMHDRESAGLGIVFSQQHLRIAREREPGRGELLRSLRDAALCTPHESVALAAWPGSDGWPHAAGRREARVERWLDIKIAYHPSRPLQAKAYLGFFARRFADRPRPAAGPAPLPAPGTI